MAIYSPMQRELKLAIKHRAVTLIRFVQVGHSVWTEPTRTYEKGRMTFEYPARIDR